MKNVFVIEDENSFIDLYSELLPRFGYEVSGWASDGFEAIKKLSIPPSPDIIIMDYRLPVKNGIDTMKSIMEFDHDVPIVFVSADGSIRSKVIAEGAKAFLQKPFKLDELIRLLKKYAR